MKKGDQHDRSDRREMHGAEGERRVQITTEGHRGEGDRRRKSRDEGNEGRHESQRWVIDLREVRILPARARDPSSQFRIGERPAERDDATERPETEDRKAAPQILKLESQRRVDTGSDHRRGHDCKACP